jgi:ubiquinone biosynthesis monooxygenase Coq7
MTAPLVPTDEVTAPTPEQRRAHRLPGDPSPADEVARMIRVDHAGEYGATRIYDGQLAVLGRSRSAAPIRAMAAQEKRHLAEFDRLIVARRIRPTALAPLWHVAGFALGAATALLGTRAAMACTVAVEEVIDAHYGGQAERLGDREPGLKATIEEFRADELEHRATALAHGARETLGYELLSTAIKAGSHLAIWLSTRI